MVKLIIALFCLFVFVACKKEEADVPSEGEGESVAEGEQAAEGESGEGEGETAEGEGAQ